MAWLHDSVHLKPWIKPPEIVVFENEAKQLFAECGPREIYPKVLENFVIFGIFTLFVFFKQYEGQNKKKRCNKLGLSFS